MERAAFARHALDRSGEKHIFIAGLARAGTTMLLRRLSEHKELCSLTYRDMPFVLAPNTWASLSGRSGKSTIAEERAHGDGVLVDVDSPEALEEVFWRVFSGSTYIGRTELLATPPDAATVGMFQTYVNLVLHSKGGARYLSKNNNNILRLDTLERAFPHALILVPFRRPLAQAQSLLTQHRRFLELHRREPFARAYMGWLAHHEFGADHRPFSFEPRARDGEDTQQLDYWLRRWIAAYRHLLRTSLQRPRRMFVSYDWCAADSTAWATILQRLELDARPLGDLRPPKAQEPNAAATPGIVAEAAEVYAELCARCTADFGLTHVHPSTGEIA